MGEGGIHFLQQAVQSRWELLLRVTPCGLRYLVSGVRGLQDGCTHKCWKGLSSGDAVTSVPNLYRVSSTGLRRVNLDSGERNKSRRTSVVGERGSEI